MLCCAVEDGMSDHSMPVVCILSAYVCSSHLGSPTLPALVCRAGGRLGAYVCFQEVFFFCGDRPSGISFLFFFLSRYWAQHQALNESR